MVTSHSDQQVSVEPAPSREEAAAIAAAIGAYLSSEAAIEDEKPTWEGRRWQLAGRIERMSSRRIQPPRHEPVDPWRALNRIRSH